MCRRDPWFVLSLLRGGTLQNWPCIVRVYSYNFRYTGNTVGFAPRDPWFSLCYFTTQDNLMPSCSRQLRTDPMFSLSFFFATGPAKLSRNRAETARVHHRCFSIGFQLRIDGFSIPGRSRPGPPLKIAAFLKVFS